MPFDAGGEIILSYANTVDRWELRLPVAPFDPATLAYTGAGPKVPTETDIGHTFAALGALWAQYFDTAWTLSLEAVFCRIAGVGTPITPPSVTPITGNLTTPNPTNPPIRRGFSFKTAFGNRQRVRLFGIGATTMDAGRNCGVATGGFDGRDQALVAYLSGLASGCVCWDGLPYPGVAWVYQRFLLRPFEPAAPGGGTDVDTNLPTGRIGDLLYYDGVQWTTLPIGPTADELTVTPVGTNLLPRWQPCCSETGTPIVTPHPSARCGAALAMAAGLERMYDAIRTTLNAMAGGGINLAFHTVASALIAAVTDGLGLPLVPAAQPVIATLARLLIGRFSFTPTLYPALSQTQKDIIARAIYCALPSGAGSTYTIGLGILQQWQANLFTQEALFSGDQLQALDLVMMVASPAQWNEVAYTGSLDASSYCNDWNCQPGRALQGGALYAAGDGKSLQGGAALSSRGRSLQGGGLFATRSPALQGGAVYA